MTQRIRIPRISARDGAGEALRAIDETGCVVIENAAKALAELAAFELAPYIGRAPNSDGIFYGYKTKRCGALVAKSGAMAQLAIEPDILAVMDAILGPNCESYLLNLTQAIRIDPGERAQFLHRDDDLFPFGHDDFDAMVNVMWALSPFTEENGATRLIPGSHKWPRDRIAQVGDTVQASMKPGDALIYLGRTLHAGGANRSASPRLGAVISYCLGFLRQTENFFLSVPWAAVEPMPERLQRMLGYGMHRPNVGWVEGRDPLEWIRAGRPSVMAARDELNPEQTAMAAEIAANPERFAAFLN
jgi:ectoine hydroxylase-related dioxygenase (phytanoyl-CoA dioxygenase family)